MNKYFRAGVCIVIGLFKFSLLKIERGSNVKVMGAVNLISPRTEITIDKGGKLIIGKFLRMRSGSKIRTRSNAKVEIGSNFSMSNNCMVVSWENIVIGDNVQFGPGVLVYDQDHDYKVPGGLAEEKYKTSPVKIGNNVWIGANTIILRGTEIGDGCVIAAGTVVKGTYPADTLIYQKKDTCTKKIVRV